MLIYCQHKSHRIEYTFKVLFEYACQCEYRYANDADEYDAYQGPKINYSNTSLNGGVHLIPSEFIHQNNIADFNIRHSEYKGHPIIFTHTEKSDLPYDPISASFFMLSRYEEYLAFENDKHGRFPLKANLSYQLGFHQEPIVHHWLNDLIEAIRTHFPPFSFEKNAYRFQPTFDIDNAYAIINKSALRTYGALFKSLSQGWDEIKFRLKVLQRKVQDPYDTYDFIQKVNEEYGTKPLFFFLMAANSAFDRNINPDSTAMAGLIKALGQLGNLGIHPSYASNSNASLLKKEIKHLAVLSEKHITQSRQHFLKIKFPETYENLIDAGIQDDYTMGFSEDLGFRAGMCVSYPFYNLTTEKERPLMIHPFAFMESSFMYHQSHDLEEIQARLEKCIEAVKNVDGTFISVWHNESLGEWDKWKGWKDLFEIMYRKASV